MPKWKETVDEVREDDEGRVVTYVTRTFRTPSKVCTPTLGADVFTQLAEMIQGFDHGFDEDECWFSFERRGKRGKTRIAVTCTVYGTRSATEQEIKEWDALQARLKEEDERRKAEEELEEAERQRLADLEADAAEGDDDAEEEVELDPQGRAKPKSGKGTKKGKGPADDRANNPVEDEIADLLGE